MKQKVLFVSAFGSVSGGGEISLMTLLQKLDRQRFEPILMLPEPGDLEKAASDIDIPVLLFPMPRLKKPVEAVRLPARVSQLAKLIKDENVSIVHVNAPARWATYAGLAARSADVPRIWHVRIMDPEGFLDRILFSIYTKIITNSDAVGEKFRGYSGHQTDDPASLSYFVD